ncbi:malonyl-ACP O-methyltransferase BioC [Paenibacillus abyssi]|uniref:Malonyl-[acyl-carrier protein] O-methyltransferase n=1 Tax=Paenibacillus abyssi TaxID=1340531 RepID=A0A917FMB9_9BACL|nr:malonyl-ACP O-methyltransferase BioC [Paenibacillus abyssi]GGF92464.1 malonyl-[acyl-carrier protein] O-methyltransferase [Paenibacillus abyssi]
MPVSKNLVKQRFDRKAETYDAHAVVQQEMTAELLRPLQLARHAMTASGPVSVLEIGCGTGRLTERLLQLLPSAYVSAVDLSPSMLQLASRRLNGDASRCTFIEADIEQWAAASADRRFDLIVSGACFQWLERPEQTLRQLLRVTRPGGRLLFSTFGPDTFQELHSAFLKAYLALGKQPQRHGLSFRSLQQWTDMLESAGWRVHVLRHKTAAQYFPAVRTFLQSVKSIGANASQASPAQGLGMRSLMAEMTACYERHYACAAGIPATYELIYVQAERPS